MKHLEDALRQPKSQKTITHLHPYNPRQTHKKQPQKWTLDPDFLQESPQEAKKRLTLAVSTVLSKQFECKKYLQEETFRDLLQDLTSLFTQCTSELEQLIRIQEALQGLPQSCSKELKNYLKHFQSLLDAKIRKMSTSYQHSEKRGKRAELVEFDRLLSGQAQPPRRNQAYFINEDGRPAIQKHFKGETLQEASRRSFGTMSSLHSGSNENQSGGSGNNQSGSGSRSGEAKALSVLLANIDAREDRKGRQQEKELEKYEFTSILSATLSVRQRNNSNHIPLEKTDLSLSSPPQDKDEAFIFHRPKLHKHRL